MPPLTLELLVEGPFFNSYKYEKSGEDGKREEKEKKFKM